MLKVKHRQFWRSYLPFLLMALVLLIGLIIVPAQPVQAAGNTYYVAKNGSDSNPGTITQPWLTIQKAFSTATAGDTVNVRAGTYNEAPDVKNSGSASGGYITFQAYNGETVIINGNGVYKWEGIITIRGKSYIKLIGFYIANGISVTYEAGVYIGKGSDHILLQSLDITNTSISGILAENSTNITVYSCHIHGTNTQANQEMISFSGVNGFEIAYCDVHDPASARRCLIDAKAGCQNGIIHHNKVHGAIANGAYGIYVDGGYTSPITDTINISIYSNQIYDMPNASVGIGLAVETGDAKLVNIQIYNNLFWNVDRAFVTDSNVGTAKVNFIFAYNTLYGSRMSGIFIPSSPAFLNNCVVSSNIVYNVGSTGYLCVLGPNYAYTLSRYSSSQLIIDNNIFFSDVGSYPTINQLGTNAKKQDPLFKSISMNDFHLLTGSPAIDRGTVAYAPSVDYDGNDRSQGAGYDIGSYEKPLNSSTPSTPSTPSNPFNPSFENDADGDSIPDGWILDKTYIRQSADIASAGSRSLKFNMAAAANDYRRAYSPLTPVISGAPYSISLDSYYSSINNAPGSYIFISYYTTTDGSGTPSYARMATVPTITGSWQTSAFTWTPPSNAKSFKILLFVDLNTIATLYFDNVQVDYEGNVSLPSSEIANPSFEVDDNGDGIPDVWSVDKNDIRQSADIASDGSRSLKFNMAAAATDYRRAYSPLTPVISAATYSVSLDSYYSSISNAPGSYIFISYYTTTDGSGTPSYAWMANVPKITGSWQTTAFTWTPPSNAKSFKILLFVDLNTIATLYFDNVQVK